MDQFRKHHPKVHGLEYIDEALKGVSFRHTIKASHETAVDLKGPLGLNRLHTSSEALIDLIFVHGLGGGSRKTWSKSEGAYHYWPKELLPRDPNFKNVRIFSFGYRADWAERNGNALDVNDFAQSLLGEINTCSEIRRINNHATSQHPTSDGKTHNAFASLASYPHKVLALPTTTTRNARLA